MKKFMSILLAITIIMSFAVVASAKDTNSAPAVTYTEQDNTVEKGKTAIVGVVSLLQSDEDGEKEYNPDTDPTNPLNWIVTIVNAVLNFFTGVFRTASEYITGQKVVTEYPFWWSQQPTPVQ